MRGAESAGFGMDRYYVLLKAWDESWSLRLFQMLSDSDPSGFSHVLVLCA